MRRVLLMQPAAWGRGENLGQFCQIGSTGDIQRYKN